MLLLKFQFQLSSSPAGAICTCARSSKALTCRLFGDAPATSGIRTCIFIKDRTHWARHSDKNLDDSNHYMVDEILRSAGDFCDVRVLTHNEDGTSARRSSKNQGTLGWHLVNHWVWAQRQVWALDQSPDLTSKEGYVKSVVDADGGRLDEAMTRKLMKKFNQKELPSLRGYDGDMLFLEDDSIVSPDVFSVPKLHVTSQSFGHTQQRRRWWSAN